jgi:hypothetical protein
VVQRVETSAASGTAAANDVRTTGPAAASTVSGTPAVPTGNGSAADSTGAADQGKTGTAGGRPSNHELDRLAAQLYDRVAARLRSELRLDRERAGLLTDIRR